MTKKIIPTAEEYSKQKNLHGAILEPSPYYWKRVRESMIEFAKLHCEAQLEAIREKSKLIWSSEISQMAYNDEVWIDDESIINSYPLENIK